AQPLTDGGDGFLDALRAVYEETHDILEMPPVPGGKPTRSWSVPILMNAATRLTVIQANLLLNGTSARGLPIERTSSYGLGMLIKECIELNAQEIVIGLSDVYTLDCGSGMAQALGALFLDYDGHEIPPTSENFIASVASIDLS